MINEIFSFRRFAKCLKFDLINAMSRYGITLAVLSFLGVIVWLFSELITFLYSKAASEEDFYLTLVSSIFLFFFAMIIISFGMPSSLYGHITDKRKGSSFIMLPASAEEKFLSMIIVCLVIIPCVFLVVYLSCDALISVLDGNYESTTELFFPPEIYVGESGFGMSVVSTYLFFAVQISVFLLGALWFKKHKIIFTILSCLALSIVFSSVLPFTLLPQTDVEDLFLSFNRTVCIFFSIFEIIILFLIWLRIKRLQH